MIKLIEGKGPGVLCNGYSIGNIVIDAPYNSKPPENTELLIITHPHCDHFIGSVNYPCKKAASIEAKELINFKNDSRCLCKLVGWDFPELKIDMGLKDGEIIELNGIKLKTIYTPGHCEGSICLYELNKKYLFSGDTVFPDYGFPRTDLPTSDISKLRDSYEKLSQLEIENIYPGHGGIIKEKDYINKLIKFL